jgi:dTDP-4-dehydrorhamnose 3,5-epimerase
MADFLIDGVVVADKKIIVDERGYIQHFMRNDDSQFDKFGEVYFSIVYNGAVKAWHLHTKMTLHYLCIYGMIKLVLFDQRVGSSTEGLLNEIFIGEKNSKMITIPPGIWNGFKGFGEREFSIVGNLADMSHDPNEIIRSEPYYNELVGAYDWNRHDG